MSRDIVLIDYGMGNLASVYNAFKFLGAKVKVSEKPQELKEAKALVLPGVGACGDAMEGLKKRGLVEVLKESLPKGALYLGICLGLQLLFEESEEGGVKGLGIFKGKVKRFSEKDGIKVPHIGWNTAKFKSQNAKCKITNGIEDNSYFYFDHSYYGDPEDKGMVTGTTDYGAPFASMINKENIYAVQFHPERSQRLGLKILKNFIDL